MAPCGAPQGSGSGCHWLPVSSSSWRTHDVEDQMVRCWIAPTPVRRRKSQWSCGTVIQWSCWPGSGVVTWGLELLRSWKLACRPSVLRGGVGSWFRLRLEPDIMVAWRQRIKRHLITTQDGCVRGAWGEACDGPDRADLIPTGSSTHRWSWAVIDDPLDPVLNDLSCLQFRSITPFSYSSQLKASITDLPSGFAEAAPACLPHTSRANVIGQKPCDIKMMTSQRCCWSVVSHIQTDKKNERRGRKEKRGMEEERYQSVEVHFLSRLLEENQFIWFSALGLKRDNIQNFEGFPEWPWIPLFLQTMSSLESTHFTWNWTFSLTSSSLRMPLWPHVSKSSRAWDQKFSSWSGSVPSCPTVNLEQRGQKSANRTRDAPLLWHW